jgi:hypothetical protein
MEEYTGSCSRPLKELWEAMTDEEAKTPLERKVQWEEHTTTELWQRFKDKQPDGMVIDKKKRVCYFYFQAGDAALW